MDNGTAREPQGESRIFDSRSSASLKAYFADLRKNEPTLMRCGRAVTERLSELGLAMAAHMEAAGAVARRAAQSLADEGWSYDVESAEAKDGRYVLLACYDAHRLSLPEGDGLRVFRAYWSDGRWWGDHKTTHWTPYAWRALTAPPALPDAVVAAWQEHGFGRNDGGIEARIEEASKQAREQTA